MDVPMHQYPTPNQHNGPSYNYQPRFGQPDYNGTYQPDPQHPYHQPYSAPFKPPPTTSRRSRFEKVMIGLHYLIFFAGIVLLAATLATIIITVQISSWWTVHVFFILFAVCSLAADFTKLHFLHRKHTVPAWSIAIEVLTLIFFVLRWVPVFYGAELLSIVTDGISDDWDKLIIPTLMMTGFTWIVFVLRLLSIFLTIIWLVRQRRRNRKVAENTV